MNEKSTVLVTGGAGFIGSHLCESLIENRQRVICIDNLHTGSLNNLKKLKRNNSFEFIKGDVKNKNVLNKLAAKSNIIYHLAAIVGVDSVVKSPKEDILTNFIGTKNVIEAAQKYDIKKIIFASSSEVYGKNTQVPLAETSNSVFGATDISRWAYGNAKSLCEHLLYAYSREGVPFVSVRFFNVYGPRSINPLYANVIPKFIVSALSNKPLTIYGNGSQIRSFTYINDAVKGLMLSSKKIKNDAINIGNNNKTSILSLAKKIIKLTNSRSRVIYIGLDKIYKTKFEDTIIRIPDISKAKEIGFEPEVNLNEGLVKTIEWIKNKSNEN